jgi:hypothetical protein
VAGPDRRERQNSFLEPLELEDLDGRQGAEEVEDPDVFERVTAVPGDLPDAALMTAGNKPDDDGISGLFERAGDTEPPPRRAPSSEPPPVLSAPTSSAKRPSRRNSRPPRAPSRPGLERPTRRSSTPTRPAIELDLEPVSARTEPARRRDALEADLPLSNRQQTSASLGPPALSSDPEVIAMKDRYATGDFSGALIVAEGILDANPQHEEALRCRARCTDVLSQMYLARLGSLNQVARVALSGDQIRWLPSTIAPASCCRSSTGSRASKRCSTSAACRDSRRSASSSDCSISG